MSDEAEVVENRRDAGQGDSQPDGESRLETGGAQTLDRLRLLRGGRELLHLAASREDIELIGGAVRDLMLGHAPKELDIVLDGAPGSFPHSAALFARELAELLPDGAEVSFHQRFGTAAVRWQGQRIDIAARRRETYASPGALPEVAPGSEEEDLARRDFTVNAIALCLGGGRRGSVRHVEGAIDDLRSGVLRVLHDGSFLDDPTRTMRLARYAARLRFAVEAHTEDLARRALAAGAMGTVSGTRVGAELRLAGSESDPVAALAEMQRLGVLAALHRRLSFDEPTVCAALELLPADGRPDLLVLAAAMTPLADAPAEAIDLLEHWEYPVADRGTIAEAALRSGSLADRMPTTGSASELWDLLRRMPVEAVALAGAIGRQRGESACVDAARRWLADLRHARLHITGNDLLGAGLAPGPEIGALLERVLRLRLDGKVEEGREAELRAALGAVGSR